MAKLHVVCWIGAFSLTASAAAQFVSGSDGSDGFFVPGDPMTVVDLGLAQTGSWDMPGDGNGVYDPDLWAVVFKYTVINIAGGVTVSFINHPSGAPVVWLVQTGVTIGGTVFVAGEVASNQGGYAPAGPGGFAGGARALGGLLPSGGFGPGGGDPPLDGSYDYGTPSILPLIGGSGAGASNFYRGASSGGAILIASSQSINLLSGSAIDANGGTGFCSGVDITGGASGGAIRLMANEVLGSGSLSAVTPGPNTFCRGPAGRIRLEAFSLDGYTGGSSPAFAASVPGLVFPPSDAPVLRATMVDDQPVPADPDAGVLTTDVVAQNDTVIITIEAMNIPPGTPVEVQVRPAHGPAIFVTSPGLAGTFAFSTVDVIVPLPLAADEVPVEIQLKANWKK